MRSNWVHYTMISNCIIFYVFKYVSGQDIVTSGFCGALYSSVLTVGAILNRNVLRDLTDLTKDVRKNNIVIS